MNFLTKRLLIGLVGSAFLLLLSACGGSTTSGDTGGVGGSSSSNNSTTTATTAATTSIDTFGVKVAQVNVKGKKTWVLTDDRGFTLYTFKPDTATTTACTKACAKTWPPRLAKEVAQLQYKGIGALSSVQDANGIQVQANDHFLYTFSKDHAPGDTNGEGVAGKWFVATPMSSGQY
ncbi:MAG TPA: hypothetical protein VFA10_02185 [Ktedonobacteraceae bacterium]|nr:hypothetical protein [Ktedonobacteraceae bacterium]